VSTVVGKKQLLRLSIPIQWRRFYYRTACYRIAIVFICFIEAKHYSSIRQFAVFQSHEKNERSRSSIAAKQFGTVAKYFAEINSH
jgi:hypothetical protein